MNAGLTSDVAIMRAAQPGDTCDLYNNGSARSCFDCLNAPLQDGTVCFLTDHGTCTNKTFSSTRQGGTLFRSHLDAYCLDNDVACHECMADSMNKSGSRTCRGENGCICLLWCQNSNRDPSSAPTSTHQDDIQHRFGAKSDDTWILVIAGAILILLVGFLVTKRLSEIRAGSTAATRFRRSRREIDGAQVKTLHLDGWHKMREALIEHERKQQACDGQTASPKQGAILPSIVELSQRSNPTSTQ
ncbi:TPA: hypothetical protein N0F65_008928 [Lagenidium giganteum]|uniref:Uncharacterized protein n=1 Tax=Lagenidium giganteum TaxID=4803 RepID=A0AAV2YQH6_9STRA|nr:TPA: hypothetical protein N0F65_008928 [Lagenidium giganteum]